MKMSRKFLASLALLSFTTATAGQALAADTASTAVNVVINGVYAVENVITTINGGAGFNPGVESTGNTTFTLKSNNGTGYRVQVKLDSTKCGAGQNYLVLGGDVANCAVESKRISTDSASATDNYFRISGYTVADNAAATGTGNTATSSTAMGITTTDANVVNDTSFVVTNGDDVTVNYATKVDYTKAAGTYQGTIIYTVSAAV